METEPQPTLKTPRLVLRPFCPDDAPTVQRLAGDARVADTTAAIPHPYEDGMAESWISTHRLTFESGKSVIFAIALRSSGKLVGAIDLRLDPDRKHGVFGYWIGVPYWGNGYCTEALEALLDFGFRSYRLERIGAVHLTRNPSSGRVMQKAGLRHEGRGRERMASRGKTETVEKYRILRSEWEGLREG